ncbi:MAG TPA: hypothetical protein VFU71_05265 [Burkholderiaceae bacterium]|nr:hypothetical protein [Burkholderiaceae bacterium]
MRKTTLLRATAIVGAFMFSFAVVPQVRAADAAPQRVAMACAHSSDATSGCQSAVRPAAAVDRVSSRTAKASAQRKSESRQIVAQTNDGSRFAYDSCGCSND